MFQQIKIAAIVLLFGLVVVLLLAVMSDYASGSDYTVTRATTIDSERPIAWLIAELGMGVLDDANDRRTGFDRLGIRAQQAQEIETTLWVDNREQRGPTSALAAWRLLGFILWDADGTVERVTDAKYRGRRVRIVDGASDGRVWVRVTIGPPLGDPRVRCARLTLEAKNGNDPTRNFDAKWGSNLSDWDRVVDRIRSSWKQMGRGSVTRLTCSADIDLPDGRCRLVRRIARRIADREAGPELSSRVAGLRSAGEAAARSGRQRLTDSVVVEFIREVCDR